MFSGLYSVAWAEATESTEVKIEAVGNVDYDMETNSATASKDVILTKDDIKIECQELFYNGKTGEVNASGNVRITTSKFVYQTETLSYNLNQKIGDLTDFTGSLKGSARDYYFSGIDGALAGESGTISNVIMTRCPEPKPEYLLKAKRIDYDSDKVYLHRVVLRVKGIPVFYFPKLSFKTDDNDLPDVRLDYDGEDGLQIGIDYTGPAKNNRSWHYKGELTTKGANRIGFGIKNYLGDLISNRVNLAYDFDDFWVIDDQFNYNTRLFNLNLDGIKEFSDEEKTELGIRLTSKYWETPIGRWRVGMLARDVYALDSSNQEYGGTYWGHQLDYNPSKFVAVSYLRLDSDETNEDYRDFLEDYKLGNNYLYDISIPITQKYSLGLDGTYNPNVEDDWVRRFYRIKYETCCLRLSAGWDDLAKSWEFNSRIKF